MTIGGGRRDQSWKIGKKRIKEQKRDLKNRKQTLKIEKRLKKQKRDLKNRKLKLNKIEKKKDLKNRQFKLNKIEKKRDLKIDNSN